MDLLPKCVFRFIRPLISKKNLLKWHMANAEKKTGLFSTALPMMALTSFFVGVGILTVDKQRELAFYRLQSVGLRKHELDEEHDKLLQFLKDTTIPANELECTPVRPENSAA